MKETNLPETPLNSWQPRPPSARLKRKIFSAQPHASSSAAWFWRGLAPATACLLLTFLALNRGNDFSTDAMNRKLETTMIMSNQSCAAYASGAQEEQNHLAAVTFDWTNHGGFQSIIRFTPPTK
jgi:hypothetical protein